MTLSHRTVAINTPTPCLLPSSLLFFSVPSRSVSLFTFLSTPCPLPPIPLSPSSRFSLSLRHYVMECTGCPASRLFLCRMFLQISDSLSDLCTHREVIQNLDGNTVERVSRIDASASAQKTSRSDRVHSEGSNASERVLQLIYSSFLLYMHIRHAYAL